MQRLPAVSGCGRDIERPVTGNLIHPVILARRKRELDPHAGGANVGPSQHRVGVRRVDVCLRKFNIRELHLQVSLNPDNVADPAGCRCDAVQTCGEQTQGTCRGCLPDRHDRGMPFEFLGHPVVELTEVVVGQVGAVEAAGGQIQIRHDAVRLGTQVFGRLASAIPASLSGVRVVLLVVRFGDRRRVPADVGNVRSGARGEVTDEGDTRPRACLRRCRHRQLRGGVRVDRVHGLRLGDARERQRSGDRCEEDSPQIFQNLHGGIPLLELDCTQMVSMYSSLLYTLL